MDKNPMEIASRRVFFISRDWILDRIDQMPFWDKSLRSFSLIFCLMSQFQGFIPFKYEIIKRYSKNITHLTIYEASISDNTRQYTSDNTRGIDILSSIQHELLKNLVHLDIAMEPGLGSLQASGLRISSLSSNLRYLRLSGPIQFDTTGRDTWIKSWWVFCVIFWTIYCLWYHLFYYLREIKSLLWLFWFNLVIQVQWPKVWRSAWYFSLPR